MKRKFLLASLIATTSLTITQAQIKKGSIWLGGAASFGTRKETFENSNNDNTRKTYSVSPAFGKAVRDNLIVGFDLYYWFTENQSDNPLVQRIKYENVGAGFFIRKYAPLGKGFYIFGQGNVNGLHLHQKLRPDYPTQVAQLESNGYAIGISFYPGVSYAVNNKLHIEAGFNNIVGLSFSHEKSTHNNQGLISVNKISNFTFSSSLSNPAPLSVGFRLLLSKA